jgi:hypothetical protein
MHSAVLRARHKTGLRWPAEMSEAPLSDADRTAVQGEWLRRTAAEYRSAAITHHVTLWLLQLTAPLELVRSGLRIVEDEIMFQRSGERIVHRGRGYRRVTRETLAWFRSARGIGG